MTPRKKHIIVKAYLEQKETHVIDGPNGTKIQLYIGRKYGDNSRETAPVVCDVISSSEEVKEICKGDLLIVHHNMLMNDAIRIEKNNEEQTVTLSMFVNNLIYAKIDRDSGELIPVCDNVIAERIEIKQSDIIESPFKVTEPMKFHVVAVPEGFEDFKAGDDILAHKLSDYEMVYHFNNQEKRAIRIWKEDVLGVFN